MHPSNTKRIVLVDGSRLLREMLKRAIERDSQLYVVAEVDQLGEISKVIEYANADWIFLILPPRKEIPYIIEHILHEHPELRILVMSTDGSQVRMRWIETHETSLEKKSLQEIMTILRENDRKVNLEKRTFWNGQTTPRKIARAVN